MSFYHVLPSNTSPDTFPKNNASLYSTPIENPYILNGQWEVALMSITHSNCIDTFNNDVMHITQNNADEETLNRLYFPTKIPLPSSKKTDIQFWIDEINKFEAVIELKRYNEFVKWKIMKGRSVILSPDLKHLFNLSSSVLSNKDESNMSHSPFKLNSEVNDPYIIVLRNRYITIKPRNTSMNENKLIEKFNAMLYTGDKIQKSKDKIVLHKTSDESKVIFFSDKIRKVLGFKHCGYREPGTYQWNSPDFHETFKDEWKAYVYDLNEMRTISARVTHDFVFKRETMLSLEAMIQVLNRVHKQVKFSLNGEGNLVMKIEKANIDVRFDDDLRDILGFQQNSYRGTEPITAKGAPSLNRMIQYFYVYSNISGMVRIGDTKAPLLAVIPYNAKPCRIKTERNFKVPMYVSVSRDHISQIDIGIYDDAGKLVPFHQDSVTNIRLHFRQTSLA